MFCQKNLICIKVGEKDSNNLAIIFQGEIALAYADYNQSPNIAFNIEALAGYYPSLCAIQPTSAQGTVSIEDILKSLASQTDYFFKNEGVTGSVINPYLVGSPIEQMKKLAKNNDFNLIIDDNEIIAIPYTKARGNNVLLSKDSGLVGYPTFTSEGIRINCIYDNNLKLGGLVKIESIVPKASGNWKIIKLSHNLSANMNGDNLWQSSFEAVYYG